MSAIAGLEIFRNRSNRCYGFPLTCFGMSGPAALTRTSTRRGSHGAYWSTETGRIGREGLAEIVIGIRSLHPRAFAFCRIWFDLPHSAFGCSTTPLSH